MTQGFLLAQVMWDARKILGFDNDGDPTPIASFNPNPEGFAERFLEDMRSIRKELDDLLALFPDDAEQDMNVQFPMLKASTATGDLRLTVGKGVNSFGKYEVVRYVRAKHYFIEFDNKEKARIEVSLKEAVEQSQIAYLNQPGCKLFDKAWEAAQLAHGVSDE